MRWLICLVLVAGAAIGAQPAWAQGGPTAVLCAGFQHQWDTVKDGTNAAAMRRVIAQISPTCSALLRQARLRLAAVERPAPPAPAPARPAVITDPDWVQLPSADDLARFYPDRASRMNVNGDVAMACEVTASGAVSGCTIVTENPPDYGFGDAALKLATLFKMAPRTRNGVPVAGGRVIIPIGFRVPTE